MYEIYTVESQDTLDSIAMKYGTTSGVLEQLNGRLFNYGIKPGMQLVVPTMNKQPYEYYTVKKGDNLYKLSKDKNVDYMTLLQLNGLEENDYIYPNQTIILPKQGFKLYLTINDDTLQSVMKKSGITIDELMKENENIYLRPEQFIVFREK